MFSLLPSRRTLYLMLTVENLASGFHWRLYSKDKNINLLKGPTKYTCSNLISADSINVTALLFVTTDWVDCPNIVVSIVTESRSGRSGFRIPGGIKDFSLLKNFQTGSGSDAASYSVYTVIFPVGKKRPGSKFNHSHSFCAQVKNSCDCEPISFIRIHGMERDNVTFLLTMWGFTYVCTYTHTHTCMRQLYVTEWMWRYARKIWSHGKFLVHSVSKAS
jgi:hypothetical protein